MQLFLLIKFRDFFFAMNPQGLWVDFYSNCLRSIHDFSLAILKTPIG